MAENVQEQQEKPETEDIKASEQANNEDNQSESNDNQDSKQSEAPKLDENEDRKKPDIQQENQDKQKPIAPPTKKIPEVNKQRIELGQPEFKNYTKQPKKTSIAAPLIQISSDKPKRKERISLDPKVKELIDARVKHAMEISEKAQKAQAEISKKLEERLSILEQKDKEDAQRAAQEQQEQKQQKQQQLKHLMKLQKQRNSELLQRIQLVKLPVRMYVQDDILNEQQQIYQIEHENNRISLQKIKEINPNIYYGNPRGKVQSVCAKPHYGHVSNFEPKFKENPYEEQNGDKSKNQSPKLGNGNGVSVQSLKEQKQDQSLNKIEQPSLNASQSMSQSLSEPTKEEHKKKKTKKVGEEKVAEVKVQDAQVDWSAEVDKAEKKKKKVKKEEK